MGFVVIYCESVGAVATAAVLVFGVVGVTGTIRSMVREFRR